MLTVPFAWRARLGFDGALLGAVVRKFADAVVAFYRRRLGEPEGVKAQSGAVLVVQPTSSDLRLNPHVNGVYVDGVFHEVGEQQVVFRGLPGSTPKDAAGLLEDATHSRATFVAVGSSQRTATTLQAPSPRPRGTRRVGSPRSQRSSPRA